MANGCYGGNWEEETEKINKKKHKLKNIFSLLLFSFEVPASIKITILKI